MYIRTSWARYVYVLRFSFYVVTVVIFSMQELKAHWRGHCHVVLSRLCVIFFMQNVQSINLDPRS